MPSNAEITAAHKENQDTILTLRNWLHDEVALTPMQRAHFEGLIVDLQIAGCTLFHLAIGTPPSPIIEAINSSPAIEANPPVRCDVMSPGGIACEDVIGHDGAHRSHGLMFGDG